MGNLNFENNYNSTPRFANVSSLSNANKSFMVEFMMKKGIVKDGKTGNNILLTFAIILFIISGFIIKNNLFPSASQIEEVQQNTSDTSVENVESEL